MAVAAARPCAPQSATQQKPPAAGAPKDFTLPAARTVHARRTACRSRWCRSARCRRSPSAWSSRPGTSTSRQGRDLAGRSDRQHDAGRDDDADADALARAFAGMGGELGISVGPDRRQYRPTCSPNGGRGRALIADVAQHPRLPDDGARARQGEHGCATWRSRRASPQAIAQEKFAQLIYGDHPYGRIFPTEAMLEGLHAGSGAGVSRQHFGADRARLYVAGVFDARRLESAIKQAFEGWAGAKAARSAPACAAVDRRRSRSIDRADAPQSTVMVGLRVPTRRTRTGSRSKSPTRSSAGRSPRASRPTSGSRRATPTRPFSQLESPSGHGATGSRRPTSRPT